MKRQEERQRVFDRVYADNAALLLRIAVRITGSQDAGEDICQEAFFRYFERIRSLPQGEEARYWLIRVVKNLSLNYEKKKERERNAYWKLGKQPVKEQLNQGEANVLARESRDEVRRALDSLPPKYRMVLILKEYEKMTYKEIGESLNLSESNVKVRVFRAREQLSQMFKKGEIYVP